MTNVMDQVDQALEVSQKIKPMLAGLGPEVTGCILVELTAMFFAGHPIEEQRDKVMLHHYAATTKLTDYYVRKRSN